MTAGPAPRGTVAEGWVVRPAALRARVRLRAGPDAPDMERAADYATAAEALEGAGGLAGTQHCLMQPIRQAGSQARQRC